MSYLGCVDVSRWQSTIDWGQVPQSIAMLKLSGGDAGLYLDPDAYSNYTNAKASGKSVGQYHFAGGGDPVEEADFFYKMGSPWEQYDVAALDWEIDTADPVGWVKAFVDEFHSKAGFWPLVYMDQSRLAANDWHSIFNTCGLWLAAPSIPFDTPIDTPYTYVMQQGPAEGVPGISGVADTDAWYGTLDAFHAYGFQLQAVAPAPLPIPPSPEPVSPPTPPVSPSTNSNPSSLPSNPTTLPTPSPTGPVTTPIDIVNIPPKRTIAEQVEDEIKRIIAEAESKRMLQTAQNVVGAVQSDVSALGAVRDWFDGKKTYTVSLAVVAGSIADYVHGHVGLSTFLSSPQGVAAQLSILLITMRAALAKVFKAL